MTNKKQEEINADYQNYIHLNHYARWREEDNRRENWEETVERLVTYLASKFDPKIDICWKEIAGAIYNKEVMPSMRLMRTAGPAADKDNSVIYNCAYMHMNRQTAFDELMHNLMCGCGQGYSVESKYVQQLPTVAEEFFESDTVIVVPDSRVGWCSSYKQFLSLLYSGMVPKWDLSKIRPRGAKLKTIGGRASGPDPLDELFRFVIGIFKRAAGRKLKPIEVHDINCKCAEIVVMGGTRRSAMIALFDAHDQEMLQCKTGDWYEDPNRRQRRLANNSAVYMDRPGISEFLHLWNTVYDSQSGEPGIFNRRAAQLQAEKTDRREADHDFGTNPCLHPDSLVETIEGRKKIKDITAPTYVYSMDKEGKLCVRKCTASWISKRDVETIKLNIASGKQLVCTPDHSVFVEGCGWIQAQDINPGDRVVHLVRNRRGAAYSGVKLTTQHRNEYQMEHKLVWESINGPIPHGHDIHHINCDTYDNHIDNLECLSHGDHARLTALEQPNNHQELGYRENSPGRHGSMWGFVSGSDSKKGKKEIIPMPEDLKSNLHQYATVVSIEQGPITDVYDLSVQDTNNFIADFVVVHNCCEIILRDRQFCNLTEVVLRHNDKYEDVKRKVRLATILGTIQSTFTDFKYLSKKWKDNCEEERLLGVSLTGIYDYDSRELKEDKLQELKQIVIDTNKEYAEKLGISQSTSTTCIKPSGTVSQLVGSSSGIHPRYSQYYIRRVECNDTNPLASFLIDQGVPYNFSEAHRTFSFEFPIGLDDYNDYDANDIPALSHLQDWLKFHNSWCEHKPSCTIQFTDDEYIALGQAIYHNFDKVSGLSFFPRFDSRFANAPYEKIDKEKYDELAKKFPKIEWAKVVEYEAEDNTTSAQELACGGGQCDI